MVVNLGLQDVQPPQDRPALGLLSRESKPFLLNELELEMGEGLRGLANQIDCTYEEWVQPNRDSTVLHTHFLNGQHSNNLEGLMATGPTVDSAYLSFCVNQDTIIDPAQWRTLIRKMVSD